MKLVARLVTSLSVLAFAATAAQAQFYKIQHIDVVGSAIGQFTTEFNPYGPATVAHASTTDSFGGLFTVHARVKYASLEFNYGYTEFTRRYIQDTSNPTYFAYVHNDEHEATAALMFHPHFRNLNPYLGIGGGGLDFIPTPSGQNEWEGAGLGEAGVELHTRNPHFGFRMGGRALFYHQPNFYQADLQTRRWVANIEPQFGAYFRY